MKTLQQRQEEAREKIELRRVMQQAGEEFPMVKASEDGRDIEEAEAHLFHVVKHDYVTDTKGQPVVKQDAVHKFHLVQWQRQRAWWEYTEVGYTIVHDPTKPAKRKGGRPKKTETQNESEG